MEGVQQEFSPELLALYYDRLFPFEEMFEWLSARSPHGSESEFFSRREFSFTLENDIYVRFQSFADCKEFRNEVRRKNPHKIDLGAVYNIRPSMKHSVNSFLPVEREFVIDIDMTDYDDIRNCCSEANICSSCWPLMTAAIKVLHRALVEDFGFQHVLWVYSGRRGVHCWISDVNVSKFDDEQRSKLVQYLHCFEGGSETSKAKLKISYPLHPSLTAADAELRSIFENEILPYQGYLDGENWKEFVAKINDTESRKVVERAFQSGKYSSPQERWKFIKSNYKQFTELVFLHCYPRLDVNVSKGMNHLLKSPFCIHPKTGRVCVPIDPEQCDHFDPFTVPTLGQLHVELDQFMDHEGQNLKREYDKTSLKPFMSYFRDTFLSRIKEHRLATSRAASEMSLQF